MTQLNDAYADLPLKDRILLTENHIKPFGAAVTNRVPCVGRRDEPLQKLPHPYKYEAAKCKDKHGPRPRTAVIKEPLNLYKRQPSARPEVNDAWQKPFAADLKFPAWPEPQPIVHPPKPLRPKGANKQRGWDDQSSQFGSIDLNAVDITDITKMLNPDDNIPARLKQEVKQTRLSDLVQEPHRMDPDDIIQRLKRTLDVDKRVKKNIKNILKQISDKICRWKNKFGDLDIQAKAVARRLRNTGELKVKVHNVLTIEMKLAEFYHEIGLTADELHLIIFTSIDHDYLSNLIILSGEFTKWFNIDFKGENREEQDFLDNKAELWHALTVMSKDVINAFNLLTRHKDASKEVIFTQKWWDSVRYSRFGVEVAKKLNKSQSLRHQLRELFWNQQDKLSYYDLFQFVEKNLGLRLESWEADALESRLDRLGFAFIEFNEFNEFTSEFGLDWQEPLLQTDLEDILDARLNLSYKNYKLTYLDYFMGCKTMLTSEKAALAKCRQIWKKMKSKNQLKYIDFDFGPQNDADVDGHKFSLYKTGKIPAKGYVKPSEIKWASPETLCDPGEIPQFVDDGASSNECKQGNLGNCWLISAMSVLVTRDELLVGGRKGMEYDPDMIVDKEIASILSNGVYPPIFHRYRSRGLYVIRIFKNFQWIYVIIDDRIPIKTTTMEPVFGSCSDPHEMWVSLIEKAYAKLHGCYGNLQSGYIDEGIQELTGFQPEKIILRNEKSEVFPHRMIEAHYGGVDGFWKFLLQRRSDNCLMGCSVKGNGKEGPQMVDGQPTGLILNHAYGINDIFELSDPYAKKKGQYIQLLRLRNPWGNSEWNGAWSSNSQELDRYRKILEQYIMSLAPDEQYDLDADDGTFLICYEDWRDNFSTLFINNDFPEDWTGIRFQSAWTPSNSGGIPNRNERQLFENYARNPQFLIKSRTDCEVMLSLQQPGGRLPPAKRVYYDYPFGETLAYANIAVFRVSGNQRYLNQFDPRNIVYMSPIKRERENSGRLKLRGGETYIVVASAERPGTVGNFFVSLYINQPYRNCEVKRVFHPDDYNEAQDNVLPIFIPEEAEKLQSRTPNWKLQLVKESLKFMITDEDPGLYAD